MYFHVSQEANQNHSAKHEKPASPVQPQAERDLDIYKEMHTQATQKLLLQQLKKQVETSPFCI